MHFLYKYFLDCLGLFALRIPLRLWRYFSHIARSILFSFALFFFFLFRPMITALPIHPLSLICVLMLLFFLQRHEPQWGGVLFQANAPRSFLSSQSRRRSPGYQTGEFVFRYQRTSEGVFQLFSSLIFSSQLTDSFHIDWWLWSIHGISSPLGSDGAHVYRSMWKRALHRTWAVPKQT